MFDFKLTKLIFSHPLDMSECLFGRSDEPGPSFLHFALKFKLLVEPVVVGAPFGSNRHHGGVAILKVD